MKKKIVFIFFTLLFFTATVFSQKIKLSQVPAAVKNSFSQQYPGITAQWEKEKDTYEAGFKKEGKMISLLYAPSGSLLESEIEISVAELSQAIKNYIKSHYRNATIKDAAKITLQDGKIQYEAAIKGKDIIFNENGNFLKEIKD